MDFTQSMEKILGGSNFKIWATIKDEIIEESGASMLKANHIYDIDGIVDKDSDTITITTSIKNKIIYCIVTDTDILKEYDAFADILITSQKKALKYINDDIYDNFLQLDMDVSKYIDDHIWVYSEDNETDNMYHTTGIEDDDIPYYRDFEISLPNADPMDKSVQKYVGSMMDNIFNGMAVVFNKGKLPMVEMILSYSNIVGESFEVVAYIDSARVLSGVIMVGSAAYTGSEKMIVLKPHMNMIHAGTHVEELSNEINDAVCGVLNYVFKITSNPVECKVKIVEKDPDFDKIDKNLQNTQKHSNGGWNDV